MKRHIGVVMAAFLLTALFGCTHIEGTRDKSSTTQRFSALGKIDSIAILPIKNDVGMLGLSSKIEAALQQSLQMAFPSARIVDVQAVGSKLAGRDLISTYGLWRASYDSTSILDPRPLQALNQATDARYFLLVHAPYLARERVRASDTGYSGLVNDANNVWRSDLKLSVELIDTQLNKVVWKGNGHSEHIHSPKKGTDLFFVIINDRNAEMSEYIGQMVATAANGVARQIAAAQ